MSCYGPMHYSIADGNGGGGEIILIKDQYKSAYTPRSAFSNTTNFSIQRCSKTSLTCQPQARFINLSMIKESNRFLLRIFPQALLNAFPVVECDYSRVVITKKLEIWTIIQIYVFLSIASRLPSYALRSLSKMEKDQSTFFFFNKRVSYFPILAALTYFEKQ